MAYIQAISYYLPETVLSNEDLVSQFPDWNSDKVSSKIGVKSRRVARVDETAGDLAEHAARKLFSEHDVSPGDIDFLILCTQSPDYKLPSTACILQHRLGIPRHAGALDIDLGCSGCVYGLSLAKGLIASGQARRILLLTSETYTKYLHPSDVSNRSIFGDGAAACLISDTGIAEIGDFVFGTDGSGADHLIVKTGGSRQCAPTAQQALDDEGHVMRDDYLYMNGGAVFNFTLDIVPQLIIDILKKNDLAFEEVDRFVFHQANKFMLSTIRKLTQIPKEKFFNDIEHTGNTVSSTVFIALAESLKTGFIGQGHSVMIAGFGVGLSWAGTVLKF